MKVTKIHEVEGGRGEENSDLCYINDFDVIDDVVFYNIKDRIVRLKINKGLVEKVVVNDETIDENINYGEISIDRRRRLLIAAKTSYGLVLFGIRKDYELERYSDINIILFSKNDQDKEYSLSRMRVNSRKHFLIVSIGWGPEEHCGKVYIVKNYSEKDRENVEVRNIFKQEETVKAIQFLKTNDEEVIVAGGTFHGSDFEWKLVDFVKGGLILTSQKCHDKPIRDIVTFISEKDKNYDDNSDFVYEKVVTCSSDGAIGIWRLDGCLVKKLGNSSFKEMQSALLLVNHRDLICCSNWGSVFTFDLSELSFIERVIPKDSRGSATHVGRCVWIKKSNRFVATQGDHTIRIYRIDGVEREFFKNDVDWEGFTTPEVLQDEKERREFITDIEMVQNYQIRNFEISFKGGYVLQSPFFLFY